MLLTAGKPLYLTRADHRWARLQLRVTDTPTWPPGSKIDAKYLAPRLQEYDRQAA